MKTFDTAQNRSFWQANTASYQGDRYSAALLRLVRPYIGRSILDAGAGSGSLVRLLRRSRGARVVGLDLAPKSPEVIEGDLSRMPFEAQEFDTVFCTEVIEHVTPRETSEILAEIGRVTRPGGHLVLTTPFEERLEENLVACPCCGETFHRWGHQQTFRAADLRRLAAAHGFEPRHVIPVKMSRLRRFVRVAAPLFRSPLQRALGLRGSGHLTLILIARKT
jgi:2-polyprenyl-3-methyl-5-hydroxy-6-metoxy-1,4-benzoquinol methylase